MAAPGLAYARIRGAMPFDVELGGAAIRLFLPTLDAAFVLKGSLVGMRRKSNRLGSDTVDAIFLAAACAGDDEAMAALREHGGRRDVRKAVSWLSDSLMPQGSAASSRVQAYLETEEGIDIGGKWARSIADRLLRRLSE